MQTGARELADSFLVGRIGTGDQEAFARFYDQHSPAVLGLLYRILGARGGAEEVLQETFLQVWRQAGRYEAHRSTPRGWLLMLPRSRPLHRLRPRPPRRRPSPQPANSPRYPPPR